MKLEEMNIDDLMVKSSLTKDDLSNIIKSNNLFFVSFVSFKIYLKNKAFQPMR